MSDWLVHHGIEGQKWGVRNGPPYPLSRQKSGKIKSTKKTEHKKKNSGYKDTKLQSGEYKINKYKNPTLERIRMQMQVDGLWAAIGIASQFIPGLAIASSIGMKARRTYYEKKNWYKKEGPPEELKNLKKQVTKTTIDDDLKTTNTRKKKQGGVSNCVNCTVNMEMRRRGYDTIARSAGMGQYTSAWKQWFDIKDSDIKFIQKGDLKNKTLNRKKYANEQYNKLMNELEKQGDGARGYLGIDYEGFNSGHAMFWEVTNGKAAIYDGQSGKTNVDNVISLADPDSYRYIRLDNKKVKPEVTMMIRSNPKKGKNK